MTKLESGRRSCLLVAAVMVAAPGCVGVAALTPPPTGSGAVAWPEGAVCVPVVGGGGGGCKNMARDEGEALRAALLGYLDGETARRELIETVRTRAAAMLAGPLTVWFDRGEQRGPSLGGFSIAYHGADLGDELYLHSEWLEVPVTGPPGATELGDLHAYVEWSCGTFVVRGVQLRLTGGDEID